MANDFGHAEQIIANELPVLGISASNITRIYSELEPCKDCSEVLKSFANAKISYSFEFDTQGKQAWSNAINDEYKKIK